jgi:regulatory protein
MRGISYQSIGLTTSNSPPGDPFEFALRLLARRSYSLAELRRALRRRFRDEAGVELALARLQVRELVDDRKFAVDYAGFLVRHRGFGRERIRRELERKGVKPQAIAPALESAFASASEEDLLTQALDKKLRALQFPLTRRKYYSLIRSLTRLGFRSDAIMRVLRARPELAPVGGDDEL